MVECRICLEDITEPVCIPCGHVHCEQCLRTHINSGNDALKSSCPTCRSTFLIAMPDLSFVPRKYHDFMIPSVRKLYLDIPSTRGMIALIEELKRCVATLSNDRDALLVQCEESRATARLHAKYETDAQLKVNALQEEVRHMQMKFDALLDQCEESKTAAGLHAMGEKNGQLKVHALQEEVRHMQMKYDALKRKKDDSLTPDDRKRKSRSVESPDIINGAEFHSSFMLKSPVKLEEHPYATEHRSSRPKRTLPRSDGASSARMQESPDPLPRFVKRQRYPDIPVGVVERMESGERDSIFSE